MTLHHRRSPRFDPHGDAFRSGSPSPASRWPPRSPSSPRTGHIRGASSIPFTSITDDGLRLKSKAELTALFAKAGVKPGDTVLGYCHIGMQATAVLFAARTLGHPVLLYDGSFQDWSRHPEYPVENPAEVARK